MAAPDDHKKLIHELAEAPPRRWRVSLLLPTHRAGAQVRQDPIRLSNLLSEAERQLRERDGGLSRESEAMLRPARALVDDRQFWNEQQGGLGVFLDADGLRSLRVPDELTERCVVHERFHVKPLLPRLEGDRTYHLLALSRQAVRLIRCTRDTVEPLPQGDIPSSLEDALGHEVERDPIQGHPGGSGRVAYHGHGKGDDDHAAELLAFLQKVDAAVHARLADAAGPIVLAGVGEVVAVFRKHSRMASRILEATVEGNPDEVEDTVLHDRSWPLVESSLDDRFERARRDYDRLAGTGRTVDGVEDVLHATAEGRVRTLMVAIDAERWGRMHDDEYTVELHDEQRAGDEDLVDRAAVLGRQRGAEVVCAVTQDMPGGRPLAAILHS